MVNNSILTKITSHINSLSDVNNSTNINTNHLSLQLIEWWSTIPPISTKITSHFNSLSDVQQFHQYQQKSLYSTHWVMVNNSTIQQSDLSPQLIEWWFHQYQQNHLSPSTHWVIVNNSTNINNNHHSPQLIKWWSTIPPISTKITSHSHWVMVNNSTNINKNHLSPQLIEWWSTIPPISTKITSTWTHWVMVNNSTQYQQKTPLTSTHWVMVNINNNHISLQLIEWWSTIPPISTKITSHLNTLSDGQQFHQYQQKSPLTSTHWVTSTIPPISTKITSHLYTLSDGQQFHQYQQKSPLTSTHWVMVNNSTNISKHHLSPSTHWMMVNNSTNINKNHLSPQLKSPLTIPPISTKINLTIEWWSTHQYQQKSPFTSTHWVVNNSTNINKNHLSPQLIGWWSTIPPISANITSHLNSLSDGKQFHQY